LGAGQRRSTCRRSTGCRASFWFVLKVSAVFFMFAMVKAMVPRYRYDQLMRIGWKVFLPISLVMIVVVAFVLQFTGWGWHGGAA
jgi:NADH-quinone oxidoreductase subunit H